MKKFTKATLKSILKNKTCQIKVKSSFDVMTDCVEQKENSSYREIWTTEIDFTNDHTFGIQGLWLVGSSRDYFNMISENEVEISNCCGSCTIRFY